MNIVAEYGLWRASGFAKETLATLPDLQSFSAAMGEEHPLRLSGDIGRYLAEPATESQVAVVAMTPNHRVVTRRPPAEDNLVSPEMMFFPHNPCESWIATGVAGFATVTGLKLHAPRLVAIMEAIGKNGEVAKRAFVLASCHEAYYLAGGSLNCLLSPLGGLLQYVNHNGTDPSSVFTAIATADTDGDSWAMNGRTPFFFLRS